MDRNALDERDTMNRRLDGWFTLNPLVSIYNILGREKAIFYLLLLICFEGARWSSGQGVLFSVRFAEANQRS
jgi:hypothetical protein